MKNDKINYNKIKPLIYTALSYLAISIIIGAFGAHMIKHQIPIEYFQIFKTANTYQFYASFALFAFIQLFIFYKSTKIIKAFYFFLLGSILFSLSLYILSLSSIKSIGIITPIGGLCMIASLFYLIFIIYKTKN